MTEHQRLVDLDVEMVSAIDDLHPILRLLMQITGLRIALVARVTEESWTCCSVIDEANFGVTVGTGLDPTTTY